VFQIPSKTIGVAGISAGEGFLWDGAQTALVIEYWYVELEIRPRV